MLDHVTIVPLLGVLDSADETYLASPWLEYGDLSRFVPERLRFLTLLEDERASHIHRPAFERFEEWNILSSHDVTFTIVVCLTR